MAVWKIVKANIRSKKGNFISIVVLLIIIAMSLSTVVSIQTNYQERIMESCRYSSVADISSFINGENVTDDMFQTIRDMKQVKSVLVRDGIAMDTKNITIGGQYYGSSAIFCKYNAKEHMYRMYDKTGTAYTGNTFPAPKEGQIYLPIAMRDKIPCALGDKVIIQKDQWQNELTIAGFYEEPMVGGSMFGVKLFLINDADYAQLLADPEVTGCAYYPLVEIYLKDSYQADANEVKKEINEKTGMVDDGFYTMIQSQTVQYTNIFVNIINTVMAAFSILLFLVVLIIIGHNVNATIEMEYRELGILKSLGFTSLHLRCSILLEYLLAGAVSAVLGVAASIPLIGFLDRIYIPITGLLMHAGIRLAETGLLLAAVLFVIAIYIVLRTRKVAAISPVQAIADGLSPVHFSGRAEFDITKVRFGNLSWRLTWKQLLGGWKKYVTNLIIVALLVFFTMTVSSIQQISNEENSEEIFGGYTDDISIAYNQDTETYIGEIREKIEQSLGIEKEFVLFSEYISVDGNEILAKMIDKTENMQSLLAGRAPKYDNEVAVTEMTAEMLHKKIGDTVELKYKGVTKPFMIVGTYQDTSDAGISVNLLGSGFKKLAPAYHEYQVSFQVKDKDHITEVVNQLTEKYKDLGESLVIKDEAKAQKESDQTMISAINSLTLLTYVLAFLFAAIISLMLCRKNFIQERRNLGIYKSLGYTAKELRRQFTLKYLCVVLFGAVLGIILNVLLNNSLVELLFVQIGLSRFTTDYNPELILFPSLFLLGITAFFAWMASGKIKQVSPKNLIQE